MRSWRDVSPLSYVSVDITESNMEHECILSRFSKSIRFSPKVLYAAPCFESVLITRFVRLLSKPLLVVGSFAETMYCSFSTN